MANIQMLEGLGDIPKTPASWALHITVISLAAYLYFIWKDKKAGVSTPLGKCPCKGKK